MNATPALGRLNTPRLRRLGLEFAALGAGAAATFGLFSAMARIEVVATPAPADEIADLRVLALPMEPPPPPREIEPTRAPSEATAPLANLQIGASDSPVKIAVVPPDIAMLYPPETTAPPARIEVTNLFTELRPKVEMQVMTRHIYQQTEVDRVPTVLHRTDPRVPSWIRRDADMLRVTLVLILEPNGRVSSARLMRPSGNRDFDKIITDTVSREWAFTPAIKNGKKVRVLLQQTVTVKWADVSPLGY